MQPEFLKKKKKKKQEENDLLSQTSATDNKNNIVMTCISLCFYQVLGHALLLLNALLFFHAFSFSHSFNCPFTHQCSYKSFKITASVKDDCHITRLLSDLLRKAGEGTYDWLYYLPSFKLKWAKYMQTHLYADRDRSRLILSPLNNRTQKTRLKAWARWSAKPMLHSLTHIGTGSSPILQGF